MANALSKAAPKKVAQKKVAQKKVVQKKRVVKKGVGRKNTGQSKTGKQASEDVIILKNVWKIFGMAAGEAMQAVQERGLGKSEILSEFGCVVGLADCSFSVKRGEIFCIMGLSGSGKSTLVRHINRLIEPTSGTIEVMGEDICMLEAEALRQMRSLHIGMVFQHMALLPHRTVRDNVAFPLQVRGEPKAKRWEISGYDQTLVLKEMDETLALGQVANAISAKDNIVFYCYTPHHMFTLYDLVVLKEPAYDASKWVIKQPTDDPNWLANSSAPTAWDATRLHIYYSASLESSHPAVAAMLASVKLETAQVNEMVYALSVERMDARAFAKGWVAKNASLVDSWFR